VFWVTKPPAYFLELAAQLALKNVRHGHGGPFGALIVRKGQVIAKGVNSVTATFDPTAHGEIVAIRKACKKLKTFSLSDCGLYTSCEPCPMCLGAALWARIPVVYYSQTRRQATLIGFDDAVFYREIDQAINGDLTKLKHQPNLTAKAAFIAWKQAPDKILY
jgi:tRNA(Arg) A34 adenosine deaminase TadA